MGRGGQFTYTSTLPLTCKLPQASNVEIRSRLQLFCLIVPARIQTRDLRLWYHIELYAPTNSTQKLKLMGRGGKFTYTSTMKASRNQAVKGKPIRIIPCYSNFVPLPEATSHTHLREWLSWWIHDCWDANWVLSVDTIASSFAYSTCASMYCIILLANLSINEQHQNRIPFGRRKSTFSLQR